MRSAASTEFKVKMLRNSNSASKKLEGKAEPVEDVQQTVQGNQRMHKWTSVEGGAHKPLKRPLTGSKSKDSILKERQVASNAEEEESVSTKIDPHVILGRLQLHSVKLRECMAENGLTEEQITEKMSDPVFGGSLVSFILKNRLDANDSEDLKRLERFLIERIGRDCQFAAQVETCSQKQAKIQEIIDDRLKRLTELSATK